MTATAEKNRQAPALEFVGMMHEGVPCRGADLEACIKFYTEVFGLRLLPRPKALDELGPGAWLTDPENRIQFHLIANDVDHTPAPGTGVTPAGRHTAWMVKDIHAFIARMEALGVPCRSITSLIGAPQVFVTDPAGHTWEFQGAPKP